VSRAASYPRNLKDDLTRLCARYDRRFLDTDPVGIVRRFDDPGDREVVGLIAAGLAYGRVASIRRSLESILRRMGPKPARFVGAFDPKADAHRFDGFVHRFTKGEDVAVLIARVRDAKERAGSLEAYFMTGDDPQSETLGPALDSFGTRLFAGLPRGHGTRWLLPLPSAGSACKRSCLFLRWMVRPDDGVDCGVWRRVSPSRLVLPLDTHLLKVVSALGWSRRKTAGWAMALEATERLRALDPADPIRFDFALSRLGILGLLPSAGGRLSPVAIRRALTAS
jgi:uncharacterized protein (TIGR02757 family)